MSGVLLGPDGALLAAAEVRFAGSRAYTRRLVEPFLATTRSTPWLGGSPVPGSPRTGSPPLTVARSDFRLQTPAFVAKILPRPVTMKNIIVYT